MTISDVIQLGKILALTAIAWCVPPRYWRKTTLAMGIMGPRDNQSVYETVLGRKYSKAEIVSIIERRHCYKREMKLQILGMKGPWRAWRPEIQLNGEIYLQKAIQGGRGTILWVLETTFSTLIVKMALYRAGYYASQLSRPGHGFSGSRFGIRYLNPIWTSVEDRFIAERILITGETGADALAVLRTRLASNGTVIITVAPLAHKFVAAPCFQGQLELPTGPLRLALTTGAALLPVFAHTKPDGGFEVTIEEPISPIQGASTPEEIAAAYAKRLEQFLLTYPDQWIGWDWVAGRLRERVPSPAR